MRSTIEAAKSTKGNNMQGLWQVTVSLALYTYQADVYLNHLFLTYLLAFWQKNQDVFFFFFFLRYLVEFIKSQIKQKNLKRNTFEKYISQKYISHWITSTNLPKYNYTLHYELMFVVVGGGVCLFSSSSFLSLYGSYCQQRKCFWFTDSQLCRCEQSLLF